MTFKSQSKTNCYLKAWTRMGEILKFMFVNKQRQCQLAQNKFSVVSCVRWRVYCIAWRVLYVSSNGGYTFGFL